MGGIKNKLNKLSNKTLFKLGSRLPSFSQPSKMPDWQISDICKPSHLGLYASKTIGSPRPITLAKYTGIACLAIAILSTLVLNIVSSYSLSKVNSKAEPVSNSNANVSTLADNEASTNALDPTSISISISISSHSATGDANDGNLSLSIPQGGGLVAGRHTVSVNVGSEIAKYSVYLNGGDNQNNTDLVNHLADSLPNTGSLATSIPSLSWSGGSGFEYHPTNFPMYGNGWGVALPDSYPGTYSAKDSYEKIIVDPIKGTEGAPAYLFSGIPPLSDGQSGDGGNRIATNKTTATSVDVYYGVKVDNPSTMLAGDYTTNVVYTVVAELKTPSISGVSPNPIRTGTTNKITLRGNNLDIVSKATIDDRGTIRDCTNITHSGTNNDTTLTCTLPAISNTGTYVITAETEGGQTTTAQIQLIPPAPTISSVSPNEINTNDSVAILTIVGTNLATTSSVYIDFNNNNTADSGEACTIKTKDNGQVTCTAPSRSSTGGPYTVRLTTDGGSVSKANAVSYVSPTPTVTSVSPSTVSPNDRGKTLTFTISGHSLSNIVQIQLTDQYNEVTYCYPNVLASSVMECRIQWVYRYPGDINATYYDSSGTAVFSDKFCTVKF